MDQNVYYFSISLSFHEAIQSNIQKVSISYQKGLNFIVANLPQYFFMSKLPFQDGIKVI